jgi:hypothetical protein
MEYRRGPRVRQTIARYAHLANDRLRHAAERTSAKIARAMSDWA